MSKLFLGPAADRNHDMRWPALLYQRKKISIFDLRSVPRRHITILRSLPENLCGANNPTISVARVSFGKHPEKLPFSSRFQVSEQLFQIFEAGNALNLFDVATIARPNHQTAVSDCEVG